MITTKARSDAPCSFRVAVVDDHSIMRTVFSAIVEDAPGMELAWSAANLAETRLRLAEQVPDLLIQDVTLPDGNGLDFTREVLSLHPDLAVLIISAEGDETSIQRAADCGARGFLSKDVSSEVVFEHLKAIQLDRR